MGARTGLASSLASSLLDVLLPQLLHLSSSAADNTIFARHALSLISHISPQGIVIGRLAFLHYVGSCRFWYCSVHSFPRVPNTTKGDCKLPRCTTNTTTIYQQLFIQHIVYFCGLHPRLATPSVLFPTMARASGSDSVPRQIFPRNPLPYGKAPKSHSLPIPRHKLSALFRASTIRHSTS